MFSYLSYFSSSVQHIPHNGLPYQNHVGTQVNLVTIQENNMVYEESNEING